MGCRALERARRARCSFLWPRTHSMEVPIATRAAALALRAAIFWCLGSGRDTGRLRLCCRTGATAPGLGCWRRSKAFFVNMLSGLNATRHPVHKAAKPAPASQTNSAREHNVCAIKPLKSIRGSPTRLSHHRDHRDNTRRITRFTLCVS